MFNATFQDFTLETLLFQKFYEVLAQNSINGDLLYTGCSKSSVPNVRAYSCLITNAMDLILFAMCYFHQPFEVFANKQQKSVHFLFIFVPFCLFQAFAGNY